MNAFKGLLWKDYMISRVWFFGWLTVMFFIYLIGIGVSQYFEEPAVALIFVVMLGFWHIAIIPIILYSMLRLEGRNQLWLHSTQSASKLLLSKIIVAFTYSTISFLLLDVLGILTLSWQQEHFTVWPWVEGIYVNLAISSTALYFGIWIITYWTFYHYLGKFPKIRSIRWLLLVLFYISYQIIATLLLRVKWLENIVGSWSVPFVSEFSFNINERGGAFDLRQTELPIPLSAMALYFIIMIGIFFLSSWLLDRKVEV